MKWAFKVTVVILLLGCFFPLQSCGRAEPPLESVPVTVLFEADLRGLNLTDEARVMQGAINIIEARLEALGITQRIVQRQGINRILVRLPNDIDVDRVVRVITNSAIFEFRELATDYATGRETWIPAKAVVNGQELTLTSRYFKDIYVEKNQIGNALLVFEWNDVGSQLSEQITNRMIGKPLGIFELGEPLIGEDGRIIAPIIRAAIKYRGQIEGLSLKEATELSKMLKAGSYPFPELALVK